ncbi:ATP-binding response regulator [Pseudoteredinibacter isoporae]|uniref:ATP-binding response regulator n=1 Tax=Pseudoteredinibacter isoporae TaxID=570281 RepID=UPI00310C120F
MAKELIEQAFLSAWKKDKHASEIDEKRHQTFMKLVRPHLIVGGVTAVLMYLLFKDYAIPGAAMIWGTCNLLTLVLSYLLFYAYDSGEKNFSGSFWGRAILLMSFLWGACWMLPSMIFLSDAPTLYVGVMFIIIISLISLPAPAMSFYPYAYFAFMSLPLSALAYLVFGLEEEGRDLLILMTPFLWGSLIFYGWDLHSSSMTSIKLRIELEEAYTEAKNANFEKSKFIATASHDIRQPLQASVFIVEAMEYTNSEKEFSRFRDNLKKSLGNISNILNGLLDISRLESGAMTSSLSHVSVKDLFDELANDYRKQVEANPDLSVRFVSNDLTVYADPLMLRRATENLYSNAIRYTASGEILIEAEMDGDTVIIRFKDTGIGIAPEHLSKIFDDFHQVKNQERDFKSGMGLGLSIVKRICDSQSWSVQVSSEPLLGSCFTLQLPLGDASSIERQVETVDFFAPLSGMTVLILDNEDLIRESLSSLVREWGAASYSANSLSEAQSLIADDALDLDLLIVDYRLEQDITGVDAMSALRDAGLVSFETIMLTGETSKDTLKRVAEADVTLLHKPIQAAKLRSAAVTLMMENSAV